MRWSIITISAAVLLAVAGKLSADTYIRPGYVSGEWKPENSPYLVEGNIFIHSDSTLVIEAGVEIIFLGHYNLIVNGLLSAIGTEADSIHFTSPGLWRGIRFAESRGASRLSYCTIQRSYMTGVICVRSRPLFSNCSINNNSSLLGGGFFFEDSYPVISDCVIVGNTSDLGGGIASLNSRLNIFNTIISGNYGMDGGGGIHADGGTLDLSRCLIAGNSSVQGDGGGIYFRGSNVSILDCQFTGNISQRDGGGLAVSTTNLVIRDCLFAQNEAYENGAGAHINSSQGMVDNCEFSGNIASLKGGGFFAEISDLHVFNCVISGNQAGIRGGGFDAEFGESIDFNHCTFYNNGSNNGPDGYALSNPVTMVNSILAGGGITSEADASILYCDFFNSSVGGQGIPDDFGDLISTNINGDSCDIYSNIFLDPLLADPSGGDFNLTFASPCIDAGNPDTPYDPDNTITDQGAYYYDQTTSVENDASLPELYLLVRNYPNPFNASTTIEYTLPFETDVDIEIFDITGRSVERFSNGCQGPGTHRITWRATDRPSGVYFVRISSGNVYNTCRMILLK